MPVTCTKMTHVFCRGMRGECGVRGAYRWGSGQGCRGSINFIDHMRDFGVYLRMKREFTEGVYKQKKSHDQVCIWEEDSGCQEGS